MIDTPYMWPAILIIAAAISLVFVVRRIMRHELAGMGAAGAVLFRVGLILVGVVYAAALPYRAPAALYAALGVAALGAVLNLTVVFTAARRSPAADPAARGPGEHDSGEHGSDELASGERGPDGRRLGEGEGRGVEEPAHPREEP